MGMPMRVRVQFSGVVQGVGFRYTTVRMASAFKVTGTVRNLPNGGVELIAEGDETELRRFVDAAKRRMSGYIQGADEVWSEAEGKFTSFRIAY